MQTQSQTKRYKKEEHKPSNKVRQLSGLFSIISSNLMLATEVLSTDYKITAVSELSSLSRKASLLAKELASDTTSLTHEDLVERISLLKSKMLSLIENLNEAIYTLDTKKKSDQSKVEDIILAKRLLRESQRGLVTIQD